MSGNAVTPGTSFMGLIDEALMQWADTRTSNGLPCSVLIDPTVRAGEATRSKGRPPVPQLATLATWDARRRA